MAYHQCWSRIAFLQVVSKTAVSRTRGSREASAMADSSAPLAGNLNAYIKTPEPVISHYLCTSIALRVEFATTAGDYRTDISLALHIGAHRGASEAHRGTSGFIGG